MPGEKSTVNEGVRAILAGKKPDRIPFIARMDFWYNGLSYDNKIPDKYAGKSLAQIHKLIGLGLEDWMAPGAFKYRKMELSITCDGQEIVREYEPEIAFFPDLWGIVPVDRAGEFRTELKTPAGTLVCVHRNTEEILRSGTTRLILVKPPVVDLEDFRVYETMIENSEFVPYFDAFYQRAADVGDSGFLVPTLNRVPFQSVLIDVMGEINCFYALHDYPRQMERLMAAIDRQTTELLHNLAGFDYPYIEFIDNLEGMMTNPHLFEQHVLPSYQKYMQITHGQGKKLGSHTDGNLAGLLTLLANSGLDVCESFTPAPLTGVTVEEALNSWDPGPMIWGGIPSYYLEERVNEEEFQEHILGLLSLVSERPIILGIADAVMTDNSVERVRWISKQIEVTPI